MPLAHFNEGRLARTVGSKQPEYFASPDLKVLDVDDGSVGIGLGEADGLDH